MSISTIIRRYCFYCKDILLNKGEIYFQMKEIRKHINDDDISYAETKYKEIKQYAIDNVPFYKDYKVNDMFPVMQKFNYIENYKIFESSNYALPCHISSTSGSTGTPFSVKQDRIKRNRNLADLKVFGELCNYPSHERMLFFRVYKRKRTKLQEWLENIFYIDFDKLGDEGSKKFCQDIIDIKPRIVFSYPNVFEDIVTYLEKHPEINMRKIGVKAFLMAGGGITQNTVSLIKKHFGCPTYRRYSDMELGILGQDTGNYDDYRLNWGSYYFECLKIDKDEPTDEGEIGRIVVTDLFNKAMPLIRYDTGDLAIMDRNGKQPVFKSIGGRKLDSFYDVNGTRKESETIGVGMWGIENVLQWQFIQHDKNDYEMKIIAKEGFIEDEVLNRLKNIIGENANIRITLVDEIPVMKSWKRKSVICEYKKDNN